MHAKASFNFGCPAFPVLLEEDKIRVSPHDYLLQEDFNEQDLNENQQDTLKIMSQRRFGLRGVDNLDLGKDKKMKELVDKVSGLNKIDEDRLTLMQGQGFQSRVVHNLLKKQCY